MKSLILCFMTIKRLLSSQDQGRPFLPVTPKSPSLVINYVFEHEPEPDPELDLTAVFASERFFFSSPGGSNSIIEYSPSVSTPQSEPSSSSSSSPSDDRRSLTSLLAVKDSVAVETYSPDLYADFRRSMEEMVEARGLRDVKASWDYLHELLLCYLALNPKSTHKFITTAFADLLVVLMSSSLPNLSPLLRD